MHPFVPPDQSSGYRRMLEELAAWLAEITGFAGHAGGEEAAADMAIDAVNPRMRRSEVAGEFRGHGVAGLAAEFRGIGVLPTPDCTRQNDQGKDSQ
jgi:glycine dehydrogenase